MNSEQTASKPTFFPWRVFTRVILIQSLLVLFAFALSGLVARYYYKRQFINQLEGKLKDTLTIVTRNLPATVTDKWCETQSANTSLRFTVFSTSGRTLCDSYRDPDEVLVGLNRPELEQAIKRGFGADLRYSRGVRSEMYYAALLVADRGVVVRASGQLTEFYATVGLFDTSFVLSLGFFGVLLAGFAIWSGQKLVFPIGRLLLKTERLLSQAPESLSREEVESDSFGEWSELESNIDSIRRDLEAKARTLDTERVELATIMGAISDAILAVDPEGIPLFYNTRFEILFGSERLRARNVKLWEIFRDPEILEAFNEALRDGRLGGTKTIPLESPDGKKTYFSLSVAPLRRQDGAIYGAVGIFHDISELKSAEQMRIDFVANVSHELRTPLTSIKGYAETLSQDVDAKKPVSKDFLTVIMKNANRLMALMEDLLDLSSIESDRLIQKDSLSTEEITNRILKQIGSRFESRNQIIKTDFSAATVYADGGRLEQILVNLLDNASKYTPVGGTISVKWDADKGDVLLKVSDTGPGIAVEHQSRLFERFYRVDKARSREQGGTGLGLAIVKHIVQRHEGRVWVESKPGEGSTFICRFPGAQ